MSRTCTICSNPRRKEIDKALLSRQSCRSIAKRFVISPAALLRHKHNDLSVVLVRRKEKEQEELIKYQSHLKKKLPSAKCADIIARVAGKVDRNPFASLRGVQYRDQVLGLVQPPEEQSKEQQPMIVIGGDAHVQVNMGPQPVQPEKLKRSEINITPERIEEGNGDKASTVTDTVK